jgi:hypothetical protein
VNETEKVPVLGYDEEGNIIPALDAKGQPMMEEVQFSSEGVAATAAAARAATNFTEGKDNVVTLTK